MTDLTTHYLGQVLPNPVVVSASPITQDLDLVRRAEDAGAGAFVMHSLFEEQIERDALDLSENLDVGAESFAEARNYFPDMRAYNTGPDGYLEQVRRVKAAVAVPVIGSLNGTTPGGWVRYARLIQEAGADAVELNVYDVPTDPLLPADHHERNVAGLVRGVAAELTVPLAVKIGPYFTAPANLARRLHEAGAQAVVLFNRFYQPDLDIDGLDVTPHLRLSHPEELLTRLHWAAILYGRVGVEVAVTGGVQTGRDVVKCVMAGADVAMMTSALLRHGVERLREVLADLRDWMADHEYPSVRRMRGCLSLHRVPDPAAYLRGNYMKVLRHQAIGL